MARSIVAVAALLFRAPVERQGGVAQSADRPHRSDGPHCASQVVILILAVVLSLPAVDTFAQHSDGTPLAAKIAVGIPDASYQTTVTAAAGTVGASADVILVNLETGHYVTTRAAADGSFTAVIFAPRGSSILVKADPERRFLSSIIDASPPLIQFHLSDMTTLHGTILTVDMPVSTSGVAFATVGIEPILNQAVAIMEGTLNKQQFSPGEIVEARGVYTILTTALTSAANPQVQIGMTLELISDSAGNPSTAWSFFDSAVMTPTGLPIERFPAFVRDYGLPFPLTKEATKGSAAFTTSFTIPADFRPGVYRPRIGAVVQGVATPPVDTSEKRTTFISELRGRFGLPVIRIGAPAEPRLPALLLMNELANGARGVVALEDRGRYAPANHIAINSDTAVIPRRDPRTGALRHYRLEPFVMTIGVSDRGGPPNAPLLPFRFPSGSLRVSVRAPSGVVRTLGPAPFRQLHLVGTGNENGHPLEGGPSITDPFELRTLDPAFDVIFEEDGKHVVVVDGSLEDLSGNIWRIGGTYEIHLAASLVIDSVVLPGTPFEVSNTFSAKAQIIPPVPAEVEVRFRQGSTDVRVHGRANRFGWFAPVTSIPLVEPGEYRADFIARHRAADGTMLVGSRTWGGVVAPRSSPIIAHGKRGIDAQKSEKQQWFFRSQTGDPIGDHVHFPFQSGDVAWLQESDSSIPAITFQDPTGSVIEKLRVLNASSNPPRFSEDQITKGEIPLFSANTNRTDIHLAPDRTEAWAYSYQAVERPLVRVRELIAEDHFLSYWRFNDRYGLQSGSGANGDLPNDFKFQFGGVVLRGPFFDSPLYAIYGSLFVLVPDNDPDGGTRVFPPFQGNGGGPSGGPLFRLKGKAIDLFFHPTALHPGMILNRGEWVSLAGYCAPALPAKVDVVVTSPSGATRSVRGQANAIGWFYDPAQDFAVLEQGVWSVKVSVMFDGRTSAGQVTAPFPSGDVLGSRQGEFYFYVVDTNAPEIEVAPMPRFVRPAEGPIVFTIAPPAGLTNLRLTYTTTMPGFLLEDGVQTSMTYDYDASTLAPDFPNLDLFDGDGLAGVDTITISLLLSGTDASGSQKHFARRIVIQGEELQMPAQTPQPRRRAVKK